jgi:hypothetical protein
MDFSAALTCLKMGDAVARLGWNGKGMFLYRVNAGSYPAYSEVAKRHWGDDGIVPYGPYIAIKSVNGTVSPWVASQTDLLADDWYTVEEHVNG